MKRAFKSPRSTIMTKKFKICDDDCDKSNDIDINFETKILDNNTLNNQIFNENLLKFNTSPNNNDKDILKINPKFLKCISKTNFDFEQKFISNLKYDIENISEIDSNNLNYNENLEPNILSIYQLSLIKKENFSSELDTNEHGIKLKSISPINTEVSNEIPSHVSSNMDPIIEEESLNALNDTKFSICLPQLQTDNKICKELKNKLDEEIKLKEEILRKLKLVEMYRAKEEFVNLEELTLKWKSCVQRVLVDLINVLGEPKPSMLQYLQHSQIDPQFVGYNVDDESFE